MRHLTSSTLGLIVFWVGYAIFATYVLYRETPPASRFLLIALGVYGAALAVFSVVIVRRPRSTPRDGSRTKAG